MGVQWPCCFLIFREGRNLHTFISTQIRVFFFLPEGAHFLPPPSLQRGGTVLCIVLIPRGGAISLFFSFFTEGGGGNRGGFFSLYIRRFHSFPLVLSFSPLFLVSPFGARTRKQNGLKRWEGRGAGALPRFFLSRHAPG